MFEYMAKLNAFENVSASGCLTSALNSESSLTMKTLVARLLVLFRILIFGAFSRIHLTIWALLSSIQQMTLISFRCLFFEACIKCSRTPNLYSLINAFELGN